MAGFFPVFFRQYWNAGADAATITARLGMANSLAGILVALLAPVIGAIADKGTYKKRFLIFFAVTGIAMSASLYTISQGRWLTAMIVYVIAVIGFSGGNVFYDALLTLVTDEERMDFVSALGFSLGYLGGGILFGVNVWMTICPSCFGLSDATEAVRLSFLMVALWWAFFSLPLIIYVREVRPQQHTPIKTIILSGMRQFIDTFHELRHLKVIFTFLIAYWLYIDGVDTVVRMAVDYGLSIGFNRNDLIAALLLTQFVGFPSAICFGLLGERIGAKRAILIAICVYLFISVWGAFIRHRYEFYLLAVIVGIVQGGIQALSRSFYARIIPEDKSAQYFGFYNMIGKFATIIGPALMGTVALIVRSMGYSSDLASRCSIISISLLFLAGGGLFLNVDEDKGKRDAQYLS